MGKVWSKERAWEWYNNHNWLRGCNFMSSDCANRIDQWQEEGFEERLKTADEELALALDARGAMSMKRRGAAKKQDAMKAPSAQACKVRKILDNHKLIVKVRRIVGQRFNIL